MAIQVIISLSQFFRSVSGAQVRRDRDLGLCDKESILRRGAPVIHTISALSRVQFILKYGTCFPYLVLPSPCIGIPYPRTPRVHRMSIFDFTLYRL